MTRILLDDAAARSEHRERAPRRQTGYAWLRHELAVKFCAVDRIADGCVITLCSARWPSGDEAEFETEPKAKCQRCAELAAGAERGTVP